MNLDKCCPIELGDLIRIGKDYDGGYILSKRHIEKTNILLSFGIRDDWSFEENFSNKKDIAIFSYDYSIKDEPFVSYASLKKCLIKSSCFMVFNLLRIHFAGFRYYKRIFRKNLILFKKFSNFFKQENRKFYVPKFLGQYDNDKYISFQTIFNEFANIDDLSIFIKMDIEGGEYFCLPQLMPFLDKVNGMAIEFHNLEIADDKFEKILDMFFEKFYIAHIHGCNIAELIYGTDIPSVLEITFINKMISPAIIIPSKKQYPVAGLDFPCANTREDYPLNFNRVVQKPQSLNNFH
jgi:hypothetical protein